MSAAAQAQPWGGLSESARQGAEGLASAMKIISDLTAMQLSLLVGMLRERVTPRPVAKLVQGAGRAITGFTDAGKILLDLAADESEIATEALKSALPLPAGIQAMADILPRGMATLVQMHKQWLDEVTEQTRDLVEWYTDGKPLQPTARLAKAARAGMVSFIEAQKQFLDVVAEQVTVATEGGKPSKAAGRDRSKALTGLARDGVAKFVAAQEKVFELAIERMASGGPATNPKPAPRSSLADVTRQSVQNFTKAQKSLLDLVLSQLQAAPEKADGRPRARRAAKRRATQARPRAKSQRTETAA